MGKNNEDLRDHLFNNGDIKSKETSSLRVSIGEETSPI